jgi:hypothetical protein
MVRGHLTAQTIAYPTVCDSHPSLAQASTCEFLVRDLPFGQDRDLRRWGLKRAERGGKNAKKRAVVAVARKLAVLLHKLWVSKEVYEPLRNNRKGIAAVA